MTVISSICPRWAGARTTFAAALVALGAHAAGNVASSGCIGTIAGTPALGATGSVVMPTATFDMCSNMNSVQPRASNIASTGVVYVTYGSDVRVMWLDGTCSDLFGGSAYRQSTRTPPCWGSLVATTACALLGGMTVSFVDAAMDTRDVLYLAEQTGRVVWAVDTVTMTATQVIGSVTACGLNRVGGPTVYPDADGVGMAARLVCVRSLQGVVVDARGALLFTTRDSISAVFRLDEDGLVRQLTDGGAFAYDWQPAQAGLAIDLSTNNLFIVDYWWNAVYRVSWPQVNGPTVTSDSVVDVIMGSTSTWCIPAVPSIAPLGSTTTFCGSPTSVAVSPRTGALYLSDYSGLLVSVVASAVSIYAGVVQPTGSWVQWSATGDGAPGASATFGYGKVTVDDPTGTSAAVAAFYTRYPGVSKPPLPPIPPSRPTTPTVLLADSQMSRLRAFNGPAAVSSTVLPRSGGSGNSSTAGSNSTGSYAAVPAVGAQLGEPCAVSTPSAAGAVYMTEWSPPRVRLLNMTTGMLSPFAGNVTCNASTPGAFRQNGVPIASACFSYPTGVEADNKGNVYVSDSDYGQVFRIDANTRTMSIFAGTSVTGRRCTAAFDGPATSVCLSSPHGIAIHPLSGDIVFADSMSLVRRVNVTTRFMTVIAGSLNSSTCNSGPATPALTLCLSKTFDVAYDRNGNLFVADIVVWRIDVNSNLATAVLGTTDIYYCSVFEQSDATSVCLNDARGIAVDAAGTLYAASDNFGIIWQLPQGALTASRMTQAHGYAVWNAASGDAASSSAAMMTQPTGVRVDASGNVYVVDQYAKNVRVIMMGNSIVCPRGNVCACGTPTPCTNASSFCPANSIAALPVSPGFSAVVESNGNAVMQAGCPAGTYCNSQGRFACPAGTYNPFSRSSNVASCQQCGAGTFSTRSTQTDSSQCQPCPPGSVSAPGSAFCTWCDVNTFAPNGSTCRCPACG